jgi:hypothetical protein
MATRQEVFEKIKTELAKRTGTTTAVCPLCHHSNWLFDPRFTTLPVIDNVKDSKPLGGMLFAMLACARCGDTRLLQLAALGFTDAASLEFEDEPKDVGSRLLKRPAYDR